MSVPPLPSRTPPKKMRLPAGCLLLWVVFRLFAFVQTDKLTQTFTWKEMCRTEKNQGNLENSEQSWRTHTAWL